MTKRSKSGFFVLTCTGLAAFLVSCASEPDNEPVFGNGNRDSNSVVGAGGSGSNAPTNPGAGGSGTAPGRGASSIGMDVPGDDECARIDVQATRVIPTVELVVDQSLSMNNRDRNAGNCGSRWQCLQRALIDPTVGVVPALEDVVNFGMTLFSGPLDLGGGLNNLACDVAMLLGLPCDAPPPPSTDACPALTRVPASLNNYDAIRATYMQAQPLGSTPTAQALERVIADLRPPDVCLDCPLEGPKIIVLVSDGDPNGCDSLTTTFGPTEAQARAAYEAGVNLYVLAMAPDQSLAHVQRMANLGVGLEANASPGAPYYVASSVNELSSALQELVGGAVTCDLEFQRGRVEGNAAAGTVELNGRTLVHGDPNGWVLRDPTHITLQGEACTTWRVNPRAIFSATFPCHLVVE